MSIKQEKTDNLSFTGLGFALSYTPAIAIVGKYFVERKALAYGIALSGIIMTYFVFLVIRFPIPSFVFWL